MLTGGMRGVRWRGLGCSFSKISDPYRLLGIARTAPSGEVKKAYLKLASQFHPDMEHGSVDNFLLIKQAYDMIKAERGQINLQNFKPEDSRPSNRPNPSRFTADEAQGMKMDRDYRVFAEKANQKHKEEYLRFNSSFKTVTDIEEIKVKVIDVEIKDPTDRFNLHLQTVQTPRLKPSFRTVFPVFALAMGFTLYIISASDNQDDQIAKMQMADNVGKTFKRSTIDDERTSKQELKLKIIRANPNLHAALSKKYHLDPTIKNIISDEYINAERNQA